MTIELMHDAGNEVWYIENNKIGSDTIDEILIKRFISTLGTKSTVVHYSLKKSLHKWFLGTQLFSSKEELIASL